MAQFSRRTVLAATDLIANWTHSSIDRFLLECGLENTVQDVSAAKKANGVARYLIGNPDALNEDGMNHTDAVVHELIEKAIQGSVDRYTSGFSIDLFRQRYSALHRGLERDGFTVEGGQLRRALPQALDLPSTDDEVHATLDRFGFAVSKGHLDQGVAAHSRGDWAAANSQFRSFIESLFDAIACRLAEGGSVPPPGNQRRIWLATRSPPFFVSELNEWDGQGRGFIEAFFKRLHPAGSHPGLSDEDDSTFRLHLVLLVARDLLRRL